MPRILILDTYYPEFLRTVAKDPAEPRDRRTKRLLDKLFGTADFYSRNLRVMGWDAIDLIANDPFVSREDVVAEIVDCTPDVLFLQDFSFLTLPELEAVKKRGTVIAGQISCALPHFRNVQQASVVFTSFPHYIDKLAAIGVRGIFCPLAFDTSVIERVLGEPMLSMSPFPRTIDVLFVGGVGNKHWVQGTKTMEFLAEKLGPERFHFYGYSIGTMPPALKKAYRGEAWGKRMYDLMLRSKIVVNRHGEVAEGYTNNMRVFEATGCGACLLTETSKNLGDFFTQDEVRAYGSEKEAFDAIVHLLLHPQELERTATLGQIRTWHEHTYFNKMRRIDKVLREFVGVDR